jgi:hypothetical protein
MRSLILLLVCFLVAGVATSAIDWAERIRYASANRFKRADGDPMAALPETMSGLDPMRGRGMVQDHMLGKAYLHVNVLAGTLAPDFSLTDNSDGHEVSLADFRGKKPVVLIFGSFSCDLFCDDVVRLKRLYQDCKDLAQFLFIHVNDAPHPIPALASVLRGLEPTFENRGERARRALKHFELNIPCLIDRADAKVETSYDAWPRRLMIVDKAGNIALDEGKGLFDGGWNLSAIKEWLRGHAN